MEQGEERHLRPLAAVRRDYADRIVPVNAAPALRRAFAAVPRERFLGPGPWQVRTAEGYVETPGDDPALVYQDAVIALVAERRLNNGLPSLHADCLAAAAPAPGEVALHIGTGSGYYTAILAELVGSHGRVTGIEIDPALAASARANLAERANVEVRCRSGLEPPLPASDLIYVNAGMTAPCMYWLEVLNPGGRLVLPLTPGWESGAVLLARKAAHGWPARFLLPAGYIPCSDGQDEALIGPLTEAFARDDWPEVRSLRLAPEPPDASCWFAGDGWWLSKAAT